MQGFEPRSGRAHFVDLDAARVEHQSLITAIGQPRYGVDVTQFPSMVGAVNQLWDGDRRRSGTPPSA